LAVFVYARSTLVRADVARVGVSHNEIRFVLIDVRCGPKRRLFSIYRPKLPFLAEGVEKTGRRVTREFA
jgi:hypothetical protein